MKVQNSDVRSDLIVPEISLALQRLINAESKCTKLVDGKEGFNS